MKLSSARSSTMKKVLARLKPYRLHVGISIFLALISVALQLYVPILVGKIVDCIVGPGNVDFIGISELLLTLALVAGGSALAQWCMGEVNNRVTYHVVRNLRDEVFRHIQHLPLSYLDATPSGEILSRMISDVDQFSAGLLMGFTQFFTGVLTILGTLAFMIRLNWGIALVVLLLTPISLLVAKFIATRTYSMFKVQAETKGRQAAIIDETIGELKVVQAFNRQKASQDAFDKVNEELRSSSLRAIFFSSLTNPCTRFVNSLVYAAVGFAGALACIGGGMSVGGLSSFLSYANQYTKPFNEISGVITELQNARACAGRLFELLAEPELSNDEETETLNHKVKGSVEISHVSFSYDPDKPLIRDFNLNVQPGQRIAIVGPTGCGKTTLINLLMRFYETDEGKILLDGVSIKQMSRKELRKNVGMVLQDTWLRSGTIKDNIAMGKPEATFAEIEAAAKAAYAHSFIRRLPEGYDTVIGESGGCLSQGQKQLLCIARVMLALPPILILDEATSSIDTRTEAQIQSAFAAMMRGRTCFIVAHRLSTIQEADLILVMRDGEIIEQGRHQALLNRGGFYAHLYNSQFTDA